MTSTNTAATNLPVHDAGAGGYPGGGEWHRGGATLAASAIGVGTSWIFFQTVAGLFIVPMHNDLGWSRSTLAIGAWTGLLSTFMLPAAGFLIDRFGPRRMALAGMPLLALGFVMLAAMPRSEPALWAIAVFLSVAGLFANSVVFAKGLATIFVHRIGSAIGLMMGATSAIAAVGLPVLAAIIAHYGWRGGFAAMALFLLFVGWPCVFLWFRPIAASRKRPSLAPEDQASILETMREGRFWHLVVALGLAALPIGGALTHLQPLLLASGIAPARAALLGTMFLIAIGSGRIIVGALLDRVVPTRVAAATLAIAAAGMLLLAEQDGQAAHVALLLGAVMMIGIGQGAESDYMSFFTLRLFGVQHFSRNIGVVAVVVSGGMAIGGLAFAAVYDHFSSYRPALYAGSLSFLLAALAFAALPLPRRGGGQTA